jgi:nucleoside-diphosphate-sugar epimerase
MKLCGFKGEIVLHPSPAGSVKRRAPKLDRLRELIGYEETVSLEEGLKRTAKAYLEPLPDIGID